MACGRRRARRTATRARSAPALAYLGYGRLARTPGSPPGPAASSAPRWPPGAGRPAVTPRRRAREVVAPRLGPGVAGAGVRRVPGGRSSPPAAVVRRRRRLRRPQPAGPRVASVPVPRPGTARRGAAACWAGREAAKCFDTRRELLPRPALRGQVPCHRPRDQDEPMTEQTATTTTPDQAAEALPGRGRARRRGHGAVQPARGHELARHRHQGAAAPPYRGRRGPRGALRGAHRLGPGVLRRPGPARARRAAPARRPLAVGDRAPALQPRSSSCWRR